MLSRLGSDRQSPEWPKFMKLYLPFIAAQIRKYPILQDWTDDVIQDVLMVVSQTIPNWQPGMPGGFRSWLRTTTRHRILETLRKSHVSRLLWHRFKNWKRSSPLGRILTAVSHSSGTQSTMSIFWPSYGPSEAPG